MGTFFRSIREPQFSFHCFWQGRQYRARLSGSSNRSTPGADG